MQVRGYEVRFFGRAGCNPNLKPPTASTRAKMQESLAQQRSGVGGAGKSGGRGGGGYAASSSYDDEGAGRATKRSRGGGGRRLWSGEEEDEEENDDITNVGRWLWSEDYEDGASVGRNGGGDGAVGRRLQASQQQLMQGGAMIGAEVSPWKAAADGYEKIMRSGVGGLQVCEATTALTHSYVTEGPCL